MSVELLEVVIVAIRRHPSGWRPGTCVEAPDAPVRLDLGDDRLDHLAPFREELLPPLALERSSHEVVGAAEPHWSGPVSLVGVGGDQRDDPALAQVVDVLV
jgi:hypothetical protein